MANDQRSHGVGVDGASIDWSFATSQAYLPPRSPLFTSTSSGNLIPDNNSNNSFFSNWPKLPHYNEYGGNGVSTNRRHHQRTPSTGFLPVQTPAWVDDLLNDAPDVPPPPGKISHRRSSSDSFAFMDQTPISDMMSPSPSNMISPFSSMVSPTSNVVSKHGNGSRDIDERSDALQKHSTLYSKPFPKHNNAVQSNANLNNAHMSTPERISTPLGSSSVPSDHDSANASSMDEKKTRGFGQPKIETEVQSALKAEPTTLSTGKGESSSMNDSILDPKRAKRILANRQSAQRSRVRKLQYISELERTVNILQEEVSALSPQVTYLDRHRIILNVDNSAMKQRLAALAQEKLFKDAHNEALKNEVHRLRQLYQQQQQQNHTGDNNQSHSNLILSPQHEIKESNEKGLDATKCVEYLLKDNEGDSMKDNIIVPSRSPPSIKPIGPSSCNSTGEKTKGIMNPQVMHTQLRSDF